MCTEPLAKYLWGNDFAKTLIPYTNRAVSDAQGNHVNVMGYRYSNIKMGKVEANYPIIVYKANHSEMLIGYTFLVDNSLIIHCGKGIGKQEKVDMIQKLNIKEDPLKCITIQKEMVPPRSLKVIKARIQYPDSWSNREKTKLIGNAVITHSEDMTDTDKIAECPHSYDIIGLDDVVHVAINNIDNSQPLYINKNVMVANAECVNEPIPLEQVQRIFIEGTSDIHSNPGELSLQNEEIPDRFEYLNQINIKADIPGLDEAVKKVLIETEPFWSKHSFDIGRYKKKAHITMKSTAVVRDKYRHINPLKEKQAADIINQLEKHKVISRSNSPYVSQPVWVWKKAPEKAGKQAVAGELDLDKKRALRLCLDYRRVNKMISSICRYPAPNIRELIFRLRNAKFVSIIDLTNSYWNIELSETSKAITGFQTASAQYIWERLPQGLTVSMSIMSEAIDDTIKSGGIADICAAYVDNVIIMSDSYENHLNDIEKVFKTFSSKGWKANPKKTHLFINNSLRLFGFHIDLENSIVAPDPQKVEGILKLPVPTNQKGVRSLCGSVNYYSDMIPGLGPLLAPIQELTKNIKFEWTKECNDNFEEIKKKISKLPAIYMPDFNAPFHVFTDAAQSQCVGYVVTQFREEMKKFVPICFGSHKLSTQELSMAQTECELFAIIHALQSESLLLAFSKVIIHTDCKSLTYLLRFARICNKLARWQIILNSYDIEIYYEKPTSLGISLADQLSRSTGKRVINRRPKMEEIDALPSIEFKNKIHMTLEEASEKIESVLKTLPPLTGGEIKIMSEKELPEVLQPHELEANSKIIKNMIKSGKLEDLSDIKFKQQYVYDKDLEFKEDVSPSGRLINIVLQEAPGLSLEALRAYQLEDDHMGPIMKKMINTMVPMDGYALKSGILLKQTKTEIYSEVSEYVICVPKKLALELVNKFHSSIFGQHADLKKLMGHLKKRFYIKNLKNYCQTVISNCKICAFNKALTRQKRPYGTKIEVTGPRQIYCLDICTIDTQAKAEGLPTSFLIIVCAWSLYTICVPINANCSAKDIIEAFTSHIIMPFGLPQGIVTDGGKNFSNNLTNQFTAALGITQYRISPYNPQANIAERVNRCILSGLRYASQDYKLNPQVFKNLIYYVVLSWNTSVLSSIKFSPYELFLSTNYDANALQSFITIQQAKQDYGSFITSLVQTQHIIENLVNQRYKARRDKRYDEKEKHSKRTEFSVGALVMVKLKEDATKRAHKLRPRFDGPFKIVKEYEANVEIIPWKENSRAKFVTKYKNEANKIPKIEKFLVNKDRIKACSPVAFYFDTALSRKFYQEFWDCIRNVAPIKLVEKHYNNSTPILDEIDAERPSSVIHPGKHLGIKNNPVIQSRKRLVRSRKSKKSKTSSSSDSDSDSGSEMDMQMGKDQNNEKTPKSPRVNTEMDNQLGINQEIENTPKNPEIGRRQSYSTDEMETDYETVTEDSNEQEGQEHETPQVKITEKQSKATKTTNLVPENIIKDKPKTTKTGKQRASKQTKNINPQKYTKWSWKPSKTTIKFKDTDTEISIPSGSAKNQSITIQNESDGNDEDEEDLEEMIDSEIENLSKQLKKNTETVPKSVYNTRSTKSYRTDPSIKTTTSKHTSNEDDKLKSINQHLEKLSENVERLQKNYDQLSIQPNIQQLSNVMDQQFEQVDTDIENMLSEQENNDE